MSFHIKMSHCRFLCFLFLGLLSENYTFARGVDLQDWNRSSSFGFEYSLSSRPLYSHYPNYQRWQLDVGYSHRNKPLTVFDPATRKTLRAIDRFNAIHFGSSAYLSPKLVLIFLGSYVFVKNSASYRFVADPANLSSQWSFIREDRTQGFEDLLFQVGYHLLEKERWGLSGSFHAQIHAGKENAFLGNKEGGYGFLFAYERFWRWGQLAANLGFTYNNSAKIPELNLDSRSKVLSSFSVLWRIYKNRIQLHTEYKRDWQLTSSQKNSPQAGYLGLRLGILHNLAGFVGVHLFDSDAIKRDRLRVSTGFKYFLGNRFGSKLEDKYRGYILRVSAEKKSKFNPNRKAKPNFFPRKHINKNMRFSNSSSFVWQKFGHPAKSSIGELDGSMRNRVLFDQDLSVLNLDAKAVLSVVRAFAVDIQGKFKINRILLQCFAGTGEQDPTVVDLAIERCKNVERHLVEGSLILDTVNILTEVVQSRVDRGVEITVEIEKDSML